MPQTAKGGTPGNGSAHTCNQTTHRKKKERASHHPNSKLNREDQSKPKSSTGPSSSKSTALSSAPSRTGSRTLAHKSKLTQGIKIKGTNKKTTTTSTSSKVLPSLFTPPKTRSKTKVPIDKGTSLLAEIEKEATVDKADASPQDPMQMNKDSEKKALEHLSKTIKQELLDNPSERNPIDMNHSPVVIVLDDNDDDKSTPPDDNTESNTSSKTKDQISPGTTAPNGSNNGSHHTLNNTKDQTSSSTTALQNLEKNTQPPSPSTKDQISFYLPNIILFAFAGFTNDDKNTTAERTAANTEDRTPSRDTHETQLNNDASNKAQQDLRVVCARPNPTVRYRDTSASKQSER